jgi:hypothetical protein
MDKNRELTGNFRSEHAAFSSQSRIGDGIAYVFGNSCARHTKKPPYKFIKFIFLFAFMSLGYELVVFRMFIMFIKFILVSTSDNTRRLRQMSNILRLVR